MFPAEIRMVLFGRLAGELAAAMTTLFEQPTEIRVMQEPDAGMLRWANCFSGFEVPEELPVDHLEWVHCWGAGTEQWQTRGLPDNCLLTRTVGEMPLRMAEFCLAYSLALLTGIFAVRNNQANRQWCEVPADLLCQQRVAVLGSGEIGRVIGQHYSALGAQVTSFSRRGAAVDGLRVLPFDQFIGIRRDFDIVINCLPLTSQTKDLIDKQLLAQMTLNHFINVGRSATVVLGDLLAALASGSIQTLVLDVHDQEPLAPDSPLWSIDRVLISPHRSAPTVATDVISSINKINQLGDESNLIVHKE